MGLTTRLLLKPSEYRELSWKAKLKPCSSLLMICTFSLASLPGEDTPALSGSLLPACWSPSADTAPQQEEAFLQEIPHFFPLLVPSPQLTSFFLLFKWPSSIQRLLPSRTSSVPICYWVAALAWSQFPWDSGATVFFLCSFRPRSCHTFLNLLIWALVSLIYSLIAHISVNNPCVEFFWIWPWACYEFPAYILS